MPGGRPTTYSQEVLDTAKDYIENYEATYGHAMPSIVGLAQVLNRARATMHAWAKEPDKKEFSDMLDALMEKQQLVLFNRSLKNEYNPTIAKLALAKHGYHDRVDSTVATTELTHEQWLESLE